jgi:hypothetical protein
MGSFQTVSTRKQCRLGRYLNCPSSYLYAEQSFASLDRVLAKLKKRVRTADKDIREVLREQTEADADGSRKELEEAKRAIQVQ